MVKRQAKENKSKEDEEWQTTDNINAGTVTLSDSQLLTKNKLKTLTNWSDRNEIKDETLEYDEDEDIEEEDYEKDDELIAEAMEMPHVRKRRSARSIHPSLGQSPLAVTFAANYDETKNKGWVKPQFSSIVYRATVRFNIFMLFNEKMKSYWKNFFYSRIFKKHFSCFYCS